MNTPLLTDQAALAQYAANADPRAFEVLTLRYRDMVLATCRRVLGASGGAGDAEDATQETFLRLARNAGKVRCAAAWLHTAALRVSIDHARHAATLRKAEARAATPDTTPAAEHDPAAHWRDLEPLIDAALAELSDADRDLLVARFLAGRPQNELAAQYNVNPGTIHRRIDAALQRLRTHLRAGGCVLGAAAVAAALHAAPSTASASPALALSLGKLALLPTTGNAAAAKVAGGVGTWLAVSAATILIGGGLTAVILTAQPSAQPAAKPTAPLAAAAASQPLLGTAGDAVGKPTKSIVGPPLMDLMTDDAPYPQVYFDGPNLHFGARFTPKGPDHDMTFRIDAIDAAANPPTMRITALALKPEIKGKAREMLDKPTDVTWSVSGRTLTVTGFVERDGKPEVSRASRPVPSTPAWREGNPQGNHPDLAGAWNTLNEVGLSLEPNAIIIRGLNGGDPVERYNIVDWTTADGYSRVQTICTAFYPTRGIVGKRIKFLIRKDKHGYTLLSHSPDGDKRDTWPASFDFSPGKGLRAMVFRTPD